MALVDLMTTHYATNPKEFTWPMVMAPLLCMWLIMKRTTIMLPDKLKEKGIRKARRLGISFGELIRESLQLSVDLPPENVTLEDPLFRDDAIYKGKAPRDLSKNTDRYLYESE